MEKIAGLQLQGVDQNCSCFCLLDFSASKGSRNSILDIFHSPFHVDFENIIFVIIWSSVDQDIAKILQGSPFKS